jgi:zinc protease
MPLPHGAARAAALFLAGLLAASGLAASRLGGAVVARLDNGLTVMVLEDHTQPLVSVQMLYRVGGRTECPGATGLAHFVEHMAYRASEHFPDTDVVSRIYAAGGEWHGYTWIDETTFFETVPVEQLGLALDIEADRMARLLLPAAELEAERGAVLTELHGYENDPATVLSDAVVAASFVAHPYRQNVIGWTSDVLGITRDEIAAFYHRHYVPANAVLAVAGDVRADDVLARVRRAFGALPGGVATPPPRTVEPPQLGLRRVEIQGAGARDSFQVSYRAPAAADPDFPAFLLLQALLSGSTGSSFRQDGEGVAARPGSLLAGIGASLKTVLAPTAQPYVFSIAGTSDPAAATPETPETIERAIEERIASLRGRPVAAAELAQARRDLETELLLDEETTEDAAHQMAFFEGIGAFPVLLRLPALLDAVTPEDLRRVAAGRLQPHQRTIGWYRAGAPPAAPEPPRPVAVAPGAAPPPPSPAAALAAPRVEVLGNGVALVVRRAPRVPAGHLRVLVPTTVRDLGAAATADDPVWRHTSIDRRFRRGELAAAAADARRALAAARPAPPSDPAQIEDPEQRLDATLRALLGARPGQGGTTPAVVAAVGDLDEREALALLAKTFGDLPPQPPAPPSPLHVARREEVAPLPGKAQSQLGYAVPAPAPADPAALPWRLLLYVLTHDYEGRLGKDLIARRGLLYSIGSRYLADGRSGWIEITAGVDPENLAATRARFAELLGDLRDHPPTAAEVEEAKQNLLGRRRTAWQSDEELSAFYAREWVEQGRLADDAEWERRVRTVTAADVARVVPGFLAGATAVVDVRPAR